ncbi:MAG: hypothetical protein ABI808_03200 [Pseudonocardiales bacterium]
MSDQGYPPPGEPGAQQPPYPGQPAYPPQPPPGYGQYPPPGYNQPPQPAPPQGYGYPTAQQPAPYGGQPGYGPPGGYLPPSYGAPGGAGASGNRTVIFAAIAVLVVALAVGGYFVFSRGSGNSGDSSTPAAAVTKLFNAAKNNDVDAAKKLVCKADLDGSETPDAKSGVLSFEVHGTTERNGLTSVEVTITTKSGSSTAPVPVVKEDGSWKVCFSALRSPPSPSGGSASGVPTEPSTLPTNPGTGGGTRTGSTDPTSECALNSTSLSAAYSYVLAAEHPFLDPNACVYKHSVPASVTASLMGKHYEPEAVDTNAPVQRFTAKDGSTLAVTTAKESDGKYYVIAVVKG